MGLKCGIVGLSTTGKTTLFNCISPVKAPAAETGFSSNKIHVSMINVPDDRLQALEKLQPTEKVVPATVEIVDIPGLIKDAGKGNSAGTKFLADIRTTDALIHLLRCFDDPAVPHMEGSVDPVRDLEIVDLELQARDLESVIKKIEKLQKMVKAGDKNAQKGCDVLQIYKQHLESFQPARTAPVSEQDALNVTDLALLSAKPVIYICNVDEASAMKGNAYVDKVKKALQNKTTEIIVIAAKLEEEIAALESLQERTDFLSSYGLDEPGVNKLIRSAYRLLNLQTFFTIGPDEIRGWTIRKNTNAKFAAGAIHSDIERGFIRAEVMKYDDFIKLSSEQACKNSGKYFIEGKDYIVQEGDILFFRFNV